MKVVQLAPQNTGWVIASALQKSKSHAYPKDKIREILGFYKDLTQFEK